MLTTESLMPWKSRVIDMYQDARILNIKHYVHEHFSTRQIDLWGSVAAETAKIVPNPAAILDVGCGTGEMCAVYGDSFPGSKVFGLDIAPGGMVKAKAANPDATFVIGDVVKLPFNPDTFDVISSLHTLPYVPDIRQSFEDVKRVLMKDGVFISTANSINSYPHVSKYRREVFQAFGWGDPVFPTTSYNLENMEQFANDIFSRHQLITLTGEMKIPVDYFMPYFMANVDVWKKEIDVTARNQIEVMVESMISRDSELGLITESKNVGILVCQK